MDPQLGHFGCSYSPTPSTSNVSGSWLSSKSRASAASAARTKLYASNRVRIEPIHLDHAFVSQHGFDSRRVENAFGNARDGQIPVTAYDHGPRKLTLVLSRGSVNFGFRCHLPFRWRFHSRRSISTRSTALATSVSESASSRKFLQLFVAHGRIQSLQPRPFPLPIDQKHETLIIRLLLRLNEQNGV